LYLDGKLTIAEMYRLYKKQQADSNIPFGKEHYYTHPYKMTNLILGSLSLKKICALNATYTIILHQKKKNNFKKSMRQIDQQKKRQGMKNQRRS
jgi:hypothetical protein